MPSTAGAFNALNIYRAKIKKEIGKSVKKYQEKDEVWQYLETAITLFTISFFVIFAVKPATATISGLLGKIKEKEEISLEMQKKINALIEAQSNFAEVQGRTALIDSFLPQDFGIAQGSAQLAGSAVDSGVSLRGFSFSEIELISAQSRKKKTDPNSLLGQQGGSLEFSFSGKSEYLRIKDFLNSLVKTRRWVEIDQFRIAKEKKESAESGLSVSLSGEFFYFKKAESVDYQSTDEAI